MNLILKGTRIELTPAIKEIVTEKISSLEKFLRPEHVVHVEIAVDTVKNGQTHRVEVTIRPHNFYAESSSTDMYEALDLVLPKIRRQLTKEKEKAVSSRRRFSKFFRLPWKKD